VEHKMHLMRHFLRKKEAEYNNIRKEWEELNGQESMTLKESKCDT